MLDRQLSGSFIIYAIAFAVAGLSPFVLLPFLTRNLSSAEFGIAAFFITCCQLMANFASLGTHGYVSVRYFKSHTRGWGSAITAAMTVVIVVHLALFVVLLVAGEWIERWLSMPLYAINLLAAASLLLCMNFIYLAVYQSSDNPKYYLAARVVQAVFEISLCLAAIYFYSATAKARIYTFPVAVGMAGLIGIYFCRKMDAFSFDGFRESIRRALRFGLPMLPHVAAGTLISFLDRIIIAAVMGPDDLGVYMAAAQLGLVMLLVIEPFNKAYAPWLFSRLAEGTAEMRVKIVRLTYLFFAVLMIIGVIATVGALIVYDFIIGAQFGAGRRLVPLIVAAYVIQGMYYTVVNYLFYSEKTYVLSAISVTTVILSSGINYVMVSLYGLQGAAISLAMNNLILFLLVWFFAAREVKLPWLSALSGRALLRPGR